MTLMNDLDRQDQVVFPRLKEITSVHEIASPLNLPRKYQRLNTKREIILKLRRASASCIGIARLQWLKQQSQSQQCPRAVFQRSGNYHECHSVFKNPA